MNLKFKIAVLTSMATISILGGQSAYATEKQTMVTVNPGDTLTAIAEAHDTTYVRLYNANDKLSSPDLLNAGDEIRVPKSDEQLPDRFAEYTAASQAAALAAPQVATTQTTSSYSTAPVDSTSYYVGNGMWCTDYVSAKRPDVPIYGNAGYNWVSAAEADGKATGDQARAGAVAVMNGHVAYVESVNPDGSYKVSEMGWNYKAGQHNVRTVQPGTFGKFIY